jgi:hypothetical protein
MAAPLSASESLVGSKSSKPIPVATLRHVLLTQYRWSRAQIDDLLTQCATPRGNKHGPRCHCDCCVNQLELEEA